MLYVGFYIHVFLLQGLGGTYVQRVIMDTLNTVFWQFRHSLKFMPEFNDDDFS